MSKKESYFWTSYSDLMTSLFFVMLILFVVVIVAISKAKIDSDRLAKASQEQLKQIERIERSIKEIDNQYFSYDDKYQRHTLKDIQVAFPRGSSNINMVNERELAKLVYAGNSIKQFLRNAQQTDDLRNTQYLVIVEGQSSRDGYAYNNQLSYDRALSLVKYWKANSIDLNSLDNCELIVSGSGCDSKYREQDYIYSNGKRIANPANQRFVIHIIPKPGFDKLTKN